MHCFLSTALIGMCFIGQALAETLATKSQSVIPGYDIVELSWKIQAHPDGSNITVNGTIENAIAEITKINPNWKVDFDFDDRVAAASQGHIPWDDWENPIRCGSPWPETIYLEKNDPISRGISYLQHKNGVPGKGPGPGQCGRVSCSEESAIYWCNDNHEAVELANYAWIADGARLIHDQCEHHGVKDWLKLSGQAFNRQKWNVIVRSDLIQC
ncbi:hypothetical protein FKW77_005011 [Venturia effusa]|uniref:Ricin B lectin domain-containing protein n=1 Tax=Venturia effusa TaxID=50376 RepID=A0A517LDN8_9PEZI|nr:hypothetical protein FKW77_005011 [Venturia effusa]